MTRKSIWDIYNRNAQGVFLGGFTNIGQWKYLIPVVAILHIAFLPLTLTFGAGLKSLIDYFTRKELPQEKLESLNNKINELDNDNIQPLIDEMAHYTPQSNSSKMLLKSLQKIPAETASVLEQAKTEKIRALQLHQLTTGTVVDPTQAYLFTFITSTKLDETHQAQLDEFLKQNEAHVKKQELTKQKAQIQTYLKADENAGKQMQHVIHNHLFPALVVPKPPVEPKDMKIEPLRVG
jgi:hypothetical protein